MGCFCATAMEPLASQLSRLQEPAETAVEPEDARKVTAVSDWLAARTLPAEPWRPDPAWQDLRLPTPLLPPCALATISGLAHLRAQALSQFGTDLLDPAQADAFTRIVATMNDRFRRQPPQRVDAREWTKLAAQNDAADRVAKALKDSLLKPSEEQLEEYNEPGGVPIRQWGDLLRPLRRLAPLIAAARQLDADVADPAQLADALRRLSRLTLPPLEAPEQMQELGSALSAVQRLRSSLRENPLERGLAHARARVRWKLEAVEQALARTLPVEQDGVEHLLTKLPRLPVTPTTLATADVVQAAQQADKLAALAWKVPEQLPLVYTGLTTCALVEHLKDALGTSPVQARPCDSHCDATALLRAAKLGAAKVPAVAA
jgi:hypothetical protein